MSRSTPNPSRHYAGDSPPVVQHTDLTDPYYWKRRKAAQKTGIDEDLLNDEPDNDAGSPEQAYA